MTIQELQERKNKLAQELRDFDRDHAGRWNEESKAEWKARNVAFDEVAKQVDEALEADAFEKSRAERLKQIEEDSKRISNDPHKVGKQSRNLGGREEVVEGQAIYGWARSRHASAEERQAAIEEGIYGAETVTINPLDSRSLQIMQEAVRNRDLDSARELVRERLGKRALSSVSQVAGGYTVTPSFLQEMEMNQLAFGSVLQAGRIIQTPGAEPWYAPTFDDTSNTASVTTENVDHGSASDPTFGQQRWSAYTYTTGVLKVPNNLLVDSSFNIDAIIAAALGERLARKVETDLTTGDGVSKPYGIVTASTVGKTTASGTAITFEEIMDLQQSVNRAYRSNGSFMMSDEILHYVRKLKDSEGRFIWMNGAAPGLPDTLLGSRIFVNLAMIGVTTGAPASATKTMLYGDMSKYIIRRAGGIVVRRLVERYAEYDQTGYIATMRIDGNILNAGTAPIKHMLQA